MMMIESSSDTCTSDFGYSKIIGNDGEIHKVSLTEEDLVRKAASTFPNSSTRRVTFAPTARVVGRIPNRADCSREEITNRWIGKEEYAALIWESSVTLTMLKCEQKKALVDDNLLCSRGLLDTASLVKRQEERSCINKLVLLELKATQDDEATAQLYHDISLTVCQRARNFAIIDEEYARRYANETGASSEQNYGRGTHYSQADNRTEIEQMILRELEKSDNLSETDQKLMRGLKRLNKRKEREAEKARQLEEMVLMQRLQQLADLYNDPSLTPEERAAVEQAANELVQGITSSSSNNNNNNADEASSSNKQQQTVVVQQTKVGDNANTCENPPKRQKIAQ